MVVMQLLFSPFSVPFPLEADALFSGPEAQCSVALLSQRVDSAVTLSFHHSFKLIGQE